MTTTMAMMMTMMTCLCFQLFSKRYGLLYDNVISTADADRKGYVTWEDVVKVAETRFSPSEYDAVCF